VAYDYAAGKTVRCRTRSSSAFGSSKDAVVGSESPGLSKPAVRWMEPGLQTRAEAEAGVMGPGASDPGNRSDDPSFSSSAKTADPTRRRPVRPSHTRLHGRYVNVKKNAADLQRMLGYSKAAATSQSSSRTEGDHRLRRQLRRCDGTAREAVTTGRVALPVGRCSEPAAGRGSDVPCESCRQRPPRQLPHRKTSARRRAARPATLSRRRRPGASSTALDDLRPLGGQVAVSRSSRRGQPRLGRAEVAAPAMPSVVAARFGVEIDDARFWGSPWSLPFFAGRSCAEVELAASGSRCGRPDVVVVLAPPTAARLTYDAAHREPVVATRLARVRPTGRLRTYPQASAAECGDLANCSLLDLRYGW